MFNVLKSKFQHFSKKYRKQIRTQFFICKKIHWIRIRYQILLKLLIWWLFDDLSFLCFCLIFFDYFDFGVLCWGHNKKCYSLKCQTSKISKEKKQILLFPSCSQRLAIIGSSKHVSRNDCSKENDAHVGFSDHHSTWSNHYPWKQMTK